MSDRLAAIGNEMARELKGSFWFLSNYLNGSCLNLSAAARESDQKN